MQHDCITCFHRLVEENPDFPDHQRRCTKLGALPEKSRLKTLTSSLSAWLDGCRREVLGLRITGRNWRAQTSKLDLREHTGLRTASSCCADAARAPLPSMHPSIGALTRLNLGGPGVNRSHLPEAEGLKKSQRQPGRVSAFQIR